MILDAAQRPGPETGKSLARWLKARCDVLAAKVRLALYVVEDAEQHAVQVLASSGRRADDG